MGERESSFEWKARARRSFQCNSVYRCSRTREHTLIIFEQSTLSYVNKVSAIGIRRVGLPRQTVATDILFADCLFSVRIGRSVCSPARRLQVCLHFCLLLAFEQVRFCLIFCLFSIRVFDVEVVRCMCVYSILIMLGEKNIKIIYAKVCFFLLFIYLYRWRKILMLRILLTLKFVYTFVHKIWL